MVQNNLSAMFTKLADEIKILSSKVTNDVYSLSQLVTTNYQVSQRVEHPEPNELAFYRALVLETTDPRVSLRVRFYCPFLHETGLPIESYPWAERVDPFGGFDDCGLVWVPPAGSTIIIMFEAGYTETAYYIGTVWNRYRGPGGQVWRNGTSPVPKEFDDVHRGHRRGYFHGPVECGDPNNEAQVLPPWNTENYNCFDSHGGQASCHVMKRSYPFIYGMKTPQKHMLKFVDGDFKCQQRWKRIELMSSLGNIMIFKDDHRNPAGQWANPQCNVPGGDPQEDCIELKNTIDENGNPKVEANIKQLDDCGVYNKVAINQYFKHQNECRPYTGPGTPQNNRCTLDQSGIQILSISGHTMIFDDSVSEPRGIPEWERGLQPFDFGCKDRFIGKMSFKSATGHLFELNDEETEPESPALRGNPDPLKVAGEEVFDPWKGTILERGNDIRPRRNGILLLSACGNRIEMSDDTRSDGVAGANRGISLQSTSMHVIEMIDNYNEQTVQARKEGGQPINKATEAFIRIRSGYGLCVEMRDNNNQQETQQQYIQVTTPQYDNCKGPHFVRLQEDKTDGYIMVRAAGEYFRFTDGHELVVVGRKEEDGCGGPKNRIVYVTDNTIVYTEKLYFNVAKWHLFWAKKYIFLLAGKDCPNPDPPPKKVPCVYMVATSRCVFRCPIVPMFVALTPKSFSRRVFASANGPSGDCFKPDAPEEEEE